MKVWLSWLGCSLLLLTGANVCAAGNAGEKSLDDIKALLAHYKPDPEKARKAREAVAKPVPDTTNGKELAEFYLERARAAEELGLFQQQLADARLAFAQDAGHDSRQELRRELARAELNGGNPLTSTKLLEEFIAGAPPVATVPTYATLSRAYVNAGDLDGAARALARGEQVRDKMPVRARERNRNQWASQYGWSKALIEMQRGQYAEAERTIREALEFFKADEADGKSRSSEAARSLFEENMLGILARSLISQNRFIEAELVLRDVVRKTITRTGRYSPASGKALTQFSNLLGQLGRRDEAVYLAQQAIESLEQAGVPPASGVFVNALRSLAHRLAEQGAYADAVKQYARLDQALVGDERLREQLGRGDVVYGLALHKTGKSAEAVPMLDVLLTKFRKTLGDKDRKTIETAGVLASALARQGEHARAAELFAFAAKALLEEEDTDEGGAVSQQRKRASILHSYIGFLAEAAKREPAKVADYAGEAFRLADAVRGQSVQRALAASAARAAASNAELAELVRREQDLGNQVGAHFALIRTALALPPDQQDAQRIASLRQGIDRMRGERKQLGQDIAAKFPEYANLVNPKPVAVAELQRALQPNEALVSYLAGEDGGFVWVVRKDKPIRFAAFQPDAAQLGKTVRGLRRALDAEVGLLQELPDFDLKAAYQLYAAILKPVEDAWADADTLLVVPDGALAQLPFALLPTQAASLGKDVDKLLFSRYRSVPWLIQKVAVVQLPTANALLTLRAAPAGKPQRKGFMAFGDPYFSADQMREAEKGATVPAKAAGDVLTKRDAVDAAQLAQLARLPDTREEVLAMARALGADAQRDVFLGTTANEKNVKSANLADYRILAFATHGLVPGELEGLVQPALALSSPVVTGNDGDGLLTVDEILGLKLDADWVVLSACNTASANTAGEEPLSGLVRAFFYAGARAVLASNWPVETSAARYLTTNIFARQTRQPNLSRAQAMRQSVQEMIREGSYVDPASKKAVFAYAHPIFWAPFSLVGDGGK